MEVECPNFSSSAIQPPLLLSVLMDLCGDHPDCLRFWQLGWEVLPGLTFLAVNRLGTGHKASKQAARDLYLIPILPRFSKPFGKKIKTPSFFHILLIIFILMEAMPASSNDN